MVRARAAARPISILLTGAVTFWIATGVTLNLTVARKIPKIAQAWWPSGVSAKVADGAQRAAAVPQLSAETADRAREALRQAVLREPVNTQGLSILATLDSYRGDQARARVLYTLSEAMSRRNILTEYWLIEDAVGRGDIAKAIKHYDRAMRVSSEARELLVPVLATAASDPVIREELLPVLAQRPLWWKNYFRRVAISGEDADAILGSIGAVRLNIGNPEERSLAEAVLRRMTALNDERGAISAANRLERIPGAVRSLREGDFESAIGLLPFAWWLRDEASMRAYRDAVPNGTTGLRVETSAGASGGVAQQRIGLAAGRQILRGMTGNVPSDPAARPFIDVSCGNGLPIARFVLPASNEQGSKFQFSFNVPATNCDSQWLNIVTAPAADTSIWIDNLTISRSAG